MSVERRQNTRGTLTLMKIVGFRARASKLSYFLDCAIRYREPVLCPSCGSQRCSLIDRKYVVSRLFECNECAIYFRHPPEVPAVSRAYYQQRYSQPDNITTSLPKSALELEQVKSALTHDQANPKNADRIRRLFDVLIGNVARAQVLDFGASWGYITWQLKSFGMDVEGYEISIPRAEYGKMHLGVVIKTDEHELRHDNQIVFSSHVIEHVPSASNMLATMTAITRHDGYVVIYCPNGSPEYRRQDPAGFHKCWGQVHPNYLNARYFMQHFRTAPYFLTSGPPNLEAVRHWDRASQVVDNLSNDELVLIVRPHEQLRKQSSSGCQG